MAKQQIAPKSDQPRMTTGELNREGSGPNLQYRVQGIKSFNRTQPRAYGRTVRG